jgi:hypothetical protein
MKSNASMERVTKEIISTVQNGEINIHPRILSVRNPGMKFTAAGLGDRIHLATLAWIVHKLTEKRVTLHLAPTHLGRGKKESFQEVFALFPSGSIDYHFHGDEVQDDNEWSRYLKKQGILSSTWHYGDFMGWNESSEGFDASSILYNFRPMSLSSTLNCESQKFITWQFDSTGVDRKLTQLQENQVRAFYENLGFEIVKVGGEAETDLLRLSLAEIAKKISLSSLHVGVDSGFYHLSLLLKGIQQIRLYNQISGYWSHHALRGRKRGIKINEALGGLGRIGYLRIALRHNNPRVLKGYHFVQRLLKRKMLK